MKKTLAILLISLQAMAGIGPFPGGSSSGGGGGGSGTVTSVGLSAPAFLSVAGSPITSSGTIALTYSGTAIPVANGGTGATTLTANNVVLGNGASAVQFVAPSTSGNVLTSNGTTWTSAALPASGVTTVGAFSGSSQTNGASISSTTITFGPADTTNPGMISTGAQTVTGNKIFIGPLSAGASSEFNVNTGGNITKINNVATNWPSVQGSANTYLKNDGNGTLSWAAVSGTGDVVGPASSVDGEIATFNGTTGKLIRSESKFKVTPATGIVNQTFTGSIPDYLHRYDLGTATTWSTIRSLTGAISSTPSTMYMDYIDFSFDLGAAARVFAGDRFTPSFSGTTSARVQRDYTYLTASSSGTSWGGNQTGASGVLGYQVVSYNTHSTGGVGGMHAIALGNKALALRGLGVMQTGTNGNAGGVTGTGSNASNPSIVFGGYFNLDANYDAGTENEVWPAVSGALVTTNGDTALDIFVARDGTTTTFSVIDGGVTQIGATGGSAIHRINGATEAAGAQSLTLTNGPTAVTSANPTVYLKIRINDVTYVIPAWPVP